MQTALHWIGTPLVRFLVVCCLFFQLPTALAQTPADNALAVYAQGKQLYDAGDFAGARSKFIEAVRIEPDNARWHYNLGLVHRQMENLPAARQSLLKARELNPDYKRAEIDQKLASMGFAATAAPGGPLAGSGTTSAPMPEESDDVAFVLWMVGGIFALVIGFIALVFWLIRRGGQTGAAPAAPAGRKGGKTAPPPDRAAIQAIAARLAPVSASLVQVEHALRLGENADLRSRLDHATRQEATVRTCLDAALQGDAHAFRKAGRTMDELEASRQGAVDLATQLHGEQAFAGSGDKVACYFCARPLANADYRRKVAMKRGDAKADVLACPNCAQVAAAGDAPVILAGADGTTHWSEVPGFDPYAARHGAPDNTQRVPAWRFAPQRPLGELALLAGGAALAGGAIAAMLRPGQAAAEPVLDLDAARESGLAQEAARAAAQQASTQRSERSADHS